MAAVVDCPEQLLLDHRHAADGLLGGVGDRPRHLGRHLRHPTVDLAVEQLDELGPADVPPLLGGRDARPGLRYHELGQRRVRRHLRLVVVGEVRRLLVAAFDAAADLGDAEEREHALVVGLRRFLRRQLRGGWSGRRLSDCGVRRQDGGSHGQRPDGRRAANRFACEHGERMPHPQPSIALICGEVRGGNEPVWTVVDLPGLAGVLYSHPCHGESGGDVHYCSMCNSGIIARVCLADVAGHGERVANVARVMHTELRASVNSWDEREVMQALDVRLEQSGLKAITTAALVSYRPWKRRLTVSYAGHPPGWIFRAGGDGKGRRWERLTITEPVAAGPCDLPLGTGFGPAYSRTHSAGDPRRPAAARHRRRARSAGARRHRVRRRRGRARAGPVPHRRQRLRGARDRAGRRPARAHRRRRDDPRRRQLLRRRRSPRPHRARRSGRSSRISSSRPSPDGADPRGCGCSAR